MSFLELAISAPTNNVVFESTSSTITFTGSVTTSAGAPTTSGVYFKWFSTVAPWASADTNAHINTTLQGTTALSFSTNKGGWGMGTQLIQFTCMDTSGMSAGDLEGVTINGVDGGKNTIVLPDWTINPRQMHVLKSAWIHPALNSRYDQGTSGDPLPQYTSPVQLYFEMRSVMKWMTKDIRKEENITNWNTDTDDELVAEIHSGSIGTSGDALYISTSAATFVADLLNSNTTQYPEYKIPCIWKNWTTTSQDTYTFYLIMYHKDNRITTVSSVKTFEVVS